MSKWLVTLFELALAIAVAVPASAAGPDLAPGDAELSRAGVAGALTRVLPATLAAEVGGETAVAGGWGGYDTAVHAPIASVTAELRLLPRLVLIAGAAWAAPNALGQGGNDLKPQLGLRYQFLNQARHGLDLGAAFLFREDRFGAEDGLFQGVLAIGRRFGPAALVINVVYGQDGEGDDHEGEVRLALLADVAPHLHLGLDGRARHSLASTDPRRVELGTPSGEMFVGPLAAITYGPIAIMTEVGVTEVWTTRTQGGITAMGGFGATF